MSFFKFGRKKDKTAASSKTSKSEKSKKKAKAALSPVGSSSEELFLASELEVEYNRFYILQKQMGSKKEIGKEVRLYSEMETPLIRIKEYLKTGVNVENIELMKVTIMGEEFEVETIPWSKIVTGLIG